MKQASITHRNSLKLFALSGTTILTMPNVLWSAKKVAKPLRFGIITDSHYADRDPAGTRFYRDALPKMNEAIKALNEADLDFLIHLGDFKDQGAEANPQETLKYLQEVETVFQRFDGDGYHALGNHDVDSIRKAEFLRNIKNAGQEQARSYYSFETSAFICIVLDANYDAAGKDHFYVEGANWEDAHIPPEELEWFKNTLTQAQKPVLVFCHHPLYPFYKEGSKFHVTNHQEVQELMEASQKVIACFHGHVHKEEFKTIKGIHYITQLGMVDYEGLENNSFSIVELDEAHLKIEGFKRASDYETRLK